MATIHLFRHGQASFGAENYDKLSPLGCRQASALGRYLSSNEIGFDVVYSGDLQRQQKTASLAMAEQSSAVEHRIDPRFNEVENDKQHEYLLPNVLEQQPEIADLLKDGLNGLEDSKKYQKLVEALFNYWVSPACNDDRLQSWADYSGGVSNAMAELMREHGSGKTIGVFASGGTIATIVSQTLGLDGSHTYHFYEPIINCSMTTLFYRSGGEKVSLSCFNDHSYLVEIGRQAGENLVTYR